MEGNDGTNHETMTKNHVAEIGRKFAWGLFQGQLMVSNGFWGSDIFSSEKSRFRTFFGVSGRFSGSGSHWGSFRIILFSRIFVGFRRVSSMGHET